MAETKKLEIIATSLITFSLQRKDILIAEPNFDSKGTDLLGFLMMDDSARFCRIQSKERSVTTTNRSSIRIKKEYISYAYIVIVFIDNGDIQNTSLYSFFKMICWILKVFGNLKIILYRLALQEEISKPSWNHIFWMKLELR